MIFLDTDHLSELSDQERSRHAIFTSRMRASLDQDFAASVVTVAEQLSGWLAYVHRFPDVHKQVPGYDRLITFLKFIRGYTIVRFDTRAADEFKRLRKQRVRIGTQDLKIASITLVHGALLLTANLRDFLQVPGLRVENWLE